MIKSWMFVLVGFLGLALATVGVIEIPMPLTSGHEWQNITANISMLIGMTMTATAIGGWALKEMLDIQRRRLLLALNLDKDHN